MFFPAQTLSLFGRPRSASQRFARSRKQSWARWLAIVFYSILAFGVPIPVDSFPITGEVFPCMHHRCGCRSADQCWRDCCCMTMEEKLAWAEANQVTPPDYVLAEARSAGLLRKKAKPKCCCCCEAKPAKSRNIARQEESCCQPKRPATQPTEPTAEKSKPEFQGVSLLAALKCRGAGDAWTGAPISLLPPKLFDSNHVAEICGMVEEVVFQISSRAISPPTPPPRFSIGCLLFCV